MNAISETRAVVLLSGGMDSVTCLAIAAAEGRAVFTMVFDYGQRHQAEIQCAARQSQAFGARDHQVVHIDLRTIAKSALTSSEVRVPKGEQPEGIPPTYVPARNTIFLSVGLAWAEVLGAEELFIGVNQVDYSGYPDCREEYIQAFERLARLATRAGVLGHPIRIRAPLLHLNKAEIIQRGLALGVDYKNTHSCYDSTEDGLACGACAACQLRLQAFAEVGVPDPIRYISG